MNGFKVYDGNANEYEQSNTDVSVGHLYPVGWSVKFVEWAGKLSPPYPVLFTTA
jgi:hypothetical protein